MDLAASGVIAKKKNVIEGRIISGCGKATRGLLATDHVILNHGQVTWTTPELAPPLLTTTPHQREDVSALDRFNVHRCPTRRVFSGTWIELMTCLPWKLEDRARAGRPCLKEARAPCIAFEMEAIASEAASGTSSAREAARRLGLSPSSVRNILRRILQLCP
ncbi:uncharacterized protein TNCV_3110271 [Trichonephila clavipes]|nr:uncharacterized protein TNCV_3110271 [Trichonephila clavipes]